MTINRWPPDVSTDGGPITHDTLDLTVQGILLNMDPYCTGTFGGQYWRSVRTSSLEDPFPVSADIWWLLKHVRLASGRYLSYWKAFLFGERTRGSLNDVSRK